MASKPPKEAAPLEPQPDNAPVAPAAPEPGTDTPDPAPEPVVAPVEPPAPGLVPAEPPAPGWEPAEAPGTTLEDPVQPIDPTSPVPGPVDTAPDELDPVVARARDRHLAFFTAPAAVNVPPSQVKAVDVAAVAPGEQLVELQRENEQVRAENNQLRADLGYARALLSEFHEREVGAPGAVPPPEAGHMVTPTIPGHPPVMDAPLTTTPPIRAGARPLA